MTFARRLEVLRYCWPERTWARACRAEYEKHVSALHRRYLRLHPDHDFTIGTTAQRSPVH